MAVLALGLLVLVAGCSGHGSGRRSTAKPNPSESAAVHRYTDAAVAVAKQWLVAAQGAVNTGDTKPVKALTAEDAPVLDRITKYVDGVWNSGSAKAPDLFRVVRVLAASIDYSTSNNATVTLLVDVDREIDYDKAGNVTHDVPPDTGLVYVFTLGRPWPPPSPGSWWVEGIQGKRLKAMPTPQASATGTAPSAVSSVG